MDGHSKVMHRMNDKRDNPKMEILNELRLDSPRSQKIMNEMGVEPDIDLKVLYFKDFISPGLTPQIVKMRYLAYVDQIVETAHEIIYRRDELISGLKTEHTRKKGKFLRETPIGYIHPKLKRGIENAMRSRQKVINKSKSLSSRHNMMKMEVKSRTSIPTKKGFGHFQSLHKDPIVASRTLRSRQSTRLNKEMSILANKQNSKLVEDKALSSIKKHLEIRDKKFKEQMQVNQEERMFKLIKKENHLKRIKDNQTRISLSRREMTRNSSNLKDSLNKSRKSEFRTHRELESQTKNHDRISPEKEAIEIEQKLEDFDRKHIQALSHKIKHHIDVVTSIAKHNSIKEQKAKEMQEFHKKVLEKKTIDCYKTYQTIEKAREEAKLLLKEQGIKRQFLKTQRDKRVKLNKKQNRINEQTELKNIMRRPQSHRHLSAEDIEKDQNDKLIRMEMDRIKAERRKMNRDREKRKLEYKKIQVVMKNEKIDKKLKEYKRILEENQQMVRNIDNLKHTEEFVDQHLAK